MMSCLNAPTKKIVEDPQQILRHVAAEEASLEVQLEQKLGLVELYYHDAKQTDRRIADKRQEIKKWDQLIEVKKLEFDKQAKELGEIRRDREQLQNSTDQLKNYIKCLQREEIERQKRRENYIARWEKIIVCEREKMNSYPLVIEKKKLENELLAASVELGVLNYRVKEEKRRREQMQDIRRLKLNYAMIKLAQDYVDMKKLEERVKFSSEELRTLKESDRSIGSNDQLEKQVMRGGITTSNVSDIARDLQEIHLPKKNAQLSRQSSMSLIDVDNVLENFKQMNTIQKMSLVPDLPPILSQTLETVKTKNVELNSEKHENDGSLTINDLLKTLRRTTPFQSIPPSFGSSSVLSQNKEKNVTKNSSVRDSFEKTDQMNLTTTIDNEKTIEVEEAYAHDAEEKLSTGSNRDSAYSSRGRPIGNTQFDNASINSSGSKISVSKSIRSAPQSHVVRNLYSSSSVKKPRVSAPKTVYKPSLIPSKSNKPLSRESNNRTSVQTQKRHQQKPMTTDIFMAKKMLSSQEESLKVVNQIQKRSGNVKFHSSVHSGYSVDNYPSVKGPPRTQKMYRRPEIQGLDETAYYQTAENHPSKDTLEKNNYVTSTYFDQMAAPEAQEKGSTKPSSDQQYMFAEDGEPNDEDMFMIPDNQDYSNLDSDNDIAAEPFGETVLSTTGSGSKCDFADNDFMLNFASNNSNHSKGSQSNYDADDDIFGFDRNSSGFENPFSFLQPSTQKSNSNRAPTFFFD